MLPLQEHDNTNKTIHILCLCLRRGPMILNFNVLGPSAGDLLHPAKTPFSGRRTVRAPVDTGITCC